LKKKSAHSFRASHVCKIVEPDGGGEQREGLSMSNPVPYKKHPPSMPNKKSSALETGEEKVEGPKDERGKGRAKLAVSESMKRILDMRTFESIRAGLLLKPNITQS